MSVWLKYDAKKNIHYCECCRSKLSETNPAYLKEHKNTLKHQNNVKIWEEDRKYWWYIMPPNHSESPLGEIIMRLTGRAT